MTDPRPPKFDGKVKFSVNQSLDQAVLRFGTDEGGQSINVGTDQLPFLLRSIREMMAKIETARAKLDPGAGKPGDYWVHSVTVPDGYSVGKIDSDKGIVLTLQDHGAPLRYLLTEKQAGELAMALAHAIAEDPQDPPSMN